MSTMGKNKGKGQRTIPLSQDQRKLLLSIIPNEKSLSSRSIDNEAGHPDPPGLAHYIKPTLIDALDLEDRPATLEGAISIYGPGSVVAASASAASDLNSSADDEINNLDPYHSQSQLNPFGVRPTNQNKATGSVGHIDQLSVTPV